MTDWMQTYIEAARQRQLAMAAAAERQRIEHHLTRIDEARRLIECQPDLNAFCEQCQIDYDAAETETWDPWISIPLRVVSESARLRFHYNREDGGSDISIEIPRLDYYHYLGKLDVSAADIGEFLLELQARVAEPDFPF